MRAPCCDKMGLKKGPWTPEEDRILTSFIQRFGHGNWRALPKQAGLLRCGKSCRLRWKNYLRPDIKRGNFSEEEQETIIKLHQGLGNRWSAIAARLPGRTDNEIKNYWHTHLKKRLKQIRQIDNIGIVHELPIRPRDVKEEYSRVSKPAENINNNLITTTHHQGDTQILQQQSHIEASGNNPAAMSYAATTSNVMEFWYNVLMQAGNSREVKENLEQFAA